MDAGLLVQHLVAAAAVALSAIYVVRRQFPQATRRVRIAVTLPLLRETRPRWVRALGRAIAPAPVAVDAACGGGCTGCAPAARTG